MADKYKDLPRYKAIDGYEHRFKSQFSAILKLAIKDVNKKMTTLIK